MVTIFDFQLLAIKLNFSLQIKKYRGYKIKSLAIKGGFPIRSSILPIARPLIDNTEIDLCIQVLKSGSLSRGEWVTKFEQEFADYSGSKFCIALSSGTAGLHLALKALNLQKDSEVIVPSLTFVATALAPIYNNLVPVFAEISKNTLMIDPEDIKRKITDKTRVIIPVHYGGGSAPIDEIMKIAEEYNLYVIEDACHAAGVSYKQKKLGTFGDMGVFSFFATKNMTAGEGGAVVTQDKELADKVRQLRAHGISHSNNQTKVSGNYDVIDVGYNYHLSHLHLAVAYAQLKKLDVMNKMRVENAKYLTHLLKGIDEIEILEYLRNTSCTYHLYTILLRLERLKIDRDEFIKALRAEGIQAGIYYRPIHMFTLFRDKYGYKEEDLPITSSICNRIITLPMYPQLQKKDLEDIGKAVDKVVYTFKKIW